MNASDEDRSLRVVRSPLTADQLRPLHPRCERLQFCTPFSGQDFRRLARFLRDYPQVLLRVYTFDYSHYDLEFLRHFSFVRRLAVDVYDLEDFDALDHLGPQLEVLSLGATKSKAISLGFLERFPRLKRLHLEGQTKDIEVVAELSRLKDISLSSATLPNLSVLKDLPSLQSLSLTLGGTRDLRVLPHLKKLRYLALRQVRGLHDLAPVGGTGSLQFLWLQGLRNVKSLPSFARLKSLRRVDLQTMKGLSDLSAIAKAPALEELAVIDMPHLEPEHFRVFVGHRRLSRLSAWIGRQRKNEAIEELLGIDKQVSKEFRFRRV